MFAELLSQTAFLAFRSEFLAPLANRPSEFERIETAESEVVLILDTLPYPSRTSVTMADATTSTSASSTTNGISVEQALSQPVDEMPVNGHQHQEQTSTSSTTTAATATATPPDDVSLADDSKSKSALIEELQAARSERDAFESQYKTLLSKLSLMRSTLGDRLRQDAEELDKRETQIESLTSQVSQLNSTVETLQSELVASHAENERVTKEFDALRASASTQSTSTAASTTTTTSSSSSSSSDHEDQIISLQSQVHTLTTSLESYKHQLSTWQSSYHEEVATRQDIQAQLDQHTLTRNTLEMDLRHWQDVAQREKDSARNLQQVLEEFQAEQESELDRVVSSLQMQYDETASALIQAQERAQTFEARYNEIKDVSHRVTHLEQETKEKNLLIGKLRHEAVILNEHLTEALRRLQKDSSDVNVDRRLVSNVLLQFLTTPRQDAKRFEILNLIGQVLQWGEEEREVAGLMKGGSGGGAGVESPRRARGVFGGGGVNSATSGTSGKNTTASDGIGREEVSLRVNETAYETAQLTYATARSPFPMPLWSFSYQKRPSRSRKRDPNQHRPLHPTHTIHHHIRIHKRSPLQHHRPCRIICAT